MVNVDVMSLREVSIAVLVEVELSSWTDAAVTTAAVNWATLSVVVVVAAAPAAVVVAFVSAFALAVLLPPAFGTAVHLFPLMLVMKAPPARVAMLSRIFYPKPCFLIRVPLFLGDSSRWTKRRVTENSKLKV